MEQRAGRPKEDHAPTVAPADGRLHGAGTDPPGSATRKLVDSEGERRVARGRGCGCVRDVTSWAWGYTHAPMYVRWSVASVVVLSTASLVLDVVVSLGYAAAGRTGLAALGFFLLAPTWAMGCFTGCCDAEQRWRHPFLAFVSAVGLAPVALAIGVLGSYGKEHGWVAAEGDDHASLGMLSMVKLAESVMESTPQLALQGYVLTAWLVGRSLDGTELEFSRQQLVVQLVSVCVSLLSLAFTVASFRLPQLYTSRWFDAAAHKTRWSEEMVVWILSFCEVALRLGSLCVFASAFGGFVFVFLAAQLLTKTVVLRLWHSPPRQDGRPRPWGRRLCCQFPELVVLTVQNDAGDPKSRAVLKTVYTAINGVATALLLLLPLLDAASESGKSIHGLCAAGTYRGSGCIPIWWFVVLCTLWGVVYVALFPAAAYLLRSQTEQCGIVRHLCACCVDHSDTAISVSDGAADGVEERATSVVVVSR